jgi:hypothetical protein
LNDVLVVYSIDVNPLGPGATATITVTPYGGASPVTVKVVTADGNIFQLTKALTGGSGGGGGPTIVTLFEDDFNRANSLTLGNGWFEWNPSPTETQILNSRLDFDSDNTAGEPLIYHSFAQQSTGVVKWTFTFNFDRTGSEMIYELFMQLGEGLTSAPAGNTAGVAVNLEWGGESNGFLDQEGFGYYDGATPTQVAVVSGPAAGPAPDINMGGDATITVIADLDAKTFDLTITGAGLISGSGTATDVPFDNNVNIDTIMIYTNGLADGNFGDLEFDNIKIEHITP